MTFFPNRCDLGLITRQTKTNPDWGILQETRVVLLMTAVVMTNKLRL